MAIKPISKLFLCKKNTAVSIFDLCPSNKYKIFLTLLYQCNEASVKLYTHLFSFHTKVVIASYGGFTYKSRSKFSLCKKAAFVSSDETFQFYNPHIDNKVLRDSLEQVGEYLFN